MTNSSGGTGSAGNTPKFPIDTRPGTLSDLGLTTSATVLSGGWVAFASNGTTLYSSGSSVVSGAINLGASASLDIKSGAVVSGIRGGGSYQYPNITIESGGTLEHSNIENGYLTISSGGVSYRNILDSDVTSVTAGGTSLNDTIYTSSGFLTTYNYDPMSVYSGGTAENTIVSGGGTLIVGSGGAATNIEAIDNGYISGASSSYISGYSLNGSASFYDYGVIDGAGSNTPDIGSDTTGRTVLGGVWSAVEVGGTGSSHSGGTTVYVSGSGTVTGNVALGNNAILHVQSGATASHVNVASSNYIDSIYVSSGGTLENSTLPNGYLYVSSGGVTENNNLNSDPVYYYAGATSINDTIYNSGYGNDPTYVYSGATVENPYISSGGVVTVYAGASLTSATNNGGTFYQSSYDSSGGTLTGVWSAVNSNGTTVYVQGANTRYGDVTLGFLSTLDVMSGADADNVQSITSSQMTIVISSGGTLSNSYVNDGTVWISSGGSSVHNLYNSVPVYISSGAVESAATYFNSGYPDIDGGTVYSGATIIGDVESGSLGYLTANSGATMLGGSVVSQGVLTTRTNTVTSGGTVVAGGTENIGGTAYNIAVSSGGVLNFTGASYNSANIASRAPIGNLPSSSFYLNNGSWKAIASNGTILYESAYSSGAMSHYVSSGGSLVNAGSASSAGTTILSGDMNVGPSVSVEITSGATVSGLQTASGGIGTVIIDGGAKLESSYLQNGYVWVSSGGVSLDNVYDSTPDYVSSGALEENGTHYNDGSYDAIQGATVYSGGTVLNPYISSGGTVLQSSGGTILNPTIVSGGAYEAIGGGMSLPTSSSTLFGSWTVIQSNGTNLYQSSYSSGQRNVQILSNGTLISGATATSSGTTSISGNVTLAGGATLEITSGVNVSGLNTTSGGIATVKVDSGATLTSSYIENGYVSLGVGASGYGNVYNSVPVYISSGAVDSKGSYYNYAYAAGDGATVYSGGSLMGPLVSNGGTVTVSSGGSVDSPVAVGGGDIYIVSGGSLNNCYLAGTLIKTPHGLKPIEILRPGDMVTCFKNGYETQEKIHFLGIGRGSFTHKGEPSLANIEDFPIRVKKDAFGENLPFKDLLLTSEHSLYFEGHFVPVRMLVNGRSIFYDIEIEDYLYYHIETESHALILADGVLSETYLDTGNRAIFDDAQYFLEDFEKKIEERGVLSWEDAAAPLNVTRSFVEPLYYLFEKNAEKMGLEKQCYPWHKEEKIQEDRNRLHLVTDRKELFYPIREAGEYILFRLPAYIEKLYLRSHLARPADVKGCFIDDRRHLGVLVGEMRLLSPDAEHVLTRHLEEEILEGWSILENDSCRWTAGGAEILLPDEGIYQSEKILAVRILDFCR